MDTVFGLLTTLEKWLGHYLGALMLLIVLDVSWQVITRFVTNQPSSYTEELARYLLVWIGLLGAAYAYRRGAHLGLDIVTRSLPPAQAVVAATVAHICCAGFALTVMVIGGWSLVQLTLDLGQLSAALQIKMGYVYSVIPLSGVLILIFAFEKIVVGCLSSGNADEKNDS